MLRVAAIALGCTFFGCDSELTGCSDGQTLVDRDGDEVGDDCVDVVDGGTEGDPCALGHACAAGFSCFFAQCAGQDCALDVGTCSADQA